MKDICMKPVEAGKILNTAVFFQLKTILGLLLATLLATGCNGGGGGGSSSAILEGTFIDSAVQGLEYETETQTGMTDENGAFTYMSGETVRFHIGDIVLGEATAQALMTPVDLVDGATDETHPMVINMARLLQTMDEDMDPDNGIFITDEMIAAMVGHMIDFNMDPDFFEHDPDVRMFMETLNGMAPLGPMRMMVSADDAQDHLYNTMDDIMSNDFGMMDENNGTMNDDEMMQGSAAMMSSRNSTMR